MAGEAQSWTYIPISEFDIPTPPATDAALGASLRLWKSFLGMFIRQERKAISDRLRWDCPPNNLLRAISPNPNWDHAAIEMADALGEDWFENPHPAQPIRVFVAAPGADIAETLVRLAQRRRLRVLTAPSPESLSAASKLGNVALEAVDDSNDQILVFPYLERWYLRHEDGLDMVRGMLERLIIRRKRVLLGCNSWAWAFLQRSIGIEDVLGEPQTFAPFDAKRLDGWFRSTFNFQVYEFRHSGNNKPVFLDSTDAGNQEVERSSVIASLAARARGNPAVALAFWRACLRTCDANGDVNAPSDATARSAVWVAALSDLALPELPVDVDRVHRFILHSILLHGGLQQSSLNTLLPFTGDDIRRRVSALQRAGILEEQDERLQVTLMAYPLVRRDLQSEGFLTDTL